MFASDRLRHAALALICVTAATGVHAQQQNSREQEQIRRLRQQVQQLQQEQTAQQQAAQKATADKSEMAVKLEAAQSELGRMKGAVSAQSRRAAEAQAELQKLRDEREQVQARLTETQGQLEGTRAALAKARADAAEQLRMLNTRNAEMDALNTRHRLQAEGLQACIASNKSLRDVGFELIDRYLNKGVGEALMQQEPFLQTRRVTLENLAQGYQDKLDQNAFKPTPALFQGDIRGGAGGAR